MIPPRVAIAFAFALGALLPLNVLGLVIVLESIWGQADD